jgi:hypothetical protein
MGSASTTVVNDIDGFNVKEGGGGKELRVKCNTAHVRTLKQHRIRY